MRARKIAFYCALSTFVFTATTLAQSDRLRKMANGLMSENIGEGIQGALIALRDLGLERQVEQKLKKEENYVVKRLGLATNKGNGALVYVPYYKAGENGSTFGNPEFIETADKPYRALFKSLAQEAVQGSIKQGAPKGYVPDPDKSYYLWYFQQGDDIRRGQISNAWMSMAVTQNKAELEKAIQRAIAFKNKPVEATGWRCNFSGTVHGSPDECQDPQKGGKWISE
jgi:hypothetical protein